MFLKNARKEDLSSKTKDEGSQGSRGIWRFMEGQRWTCSQPDNFVNRRMTRYDRSCLFSFFDTCRRKVPLWINLTRENMRISARKRCFHIQFLHLYSLFRRRERLFDTETTKMVKMTSFQFFQYFTDIKQCIFRDLNKSFLFFFTLTFLMEILRFFKIFQILKIVLVLLC